MVRSYFDKLAARRYEFNNNSNYYYYHYDLDGQSLTFSLFSLSLNLTRNKMVLKIIYRAATTNQRNVYGQKIK